MIANDGRIVQFQLHLSKATRNGRPEIVGVMTDITELKEMERSARELSGRLIRVQDEERRRISRNLHDSVGQYLSALKVNLDRLARTQSTLSPQESKLLNESREIADLALGEVRTVSHLLHPPILDALGLRRALEALVEGYSRRGGIDVRLDLQLPGSRLHQDLELALYRTVQECLTNVHRHSGSPSAMVLVGKNGHSVYAEVRDRGNGMPKELLDKIQAGMGGAGVGLSGLRERIHELGGDLEITSSKRGTAVRATVPIDHSGNHAGNHGNRSDGKIESSRMLTVPTRSSH